MKYTIILLLTLLIATKEDVSAFTINPFIIYLQENGYYELINDVKCQLTTDVAIEVCKILTESPHCEEVVRIYMSCPNPPCYAPSSPSSPTLSSPTSFSRARSCPSPSLPPADRLISILDAHNMPHDKFKRLILKLRLKLIILEPIIQPPNRKETINEKHDSLLQEKKIRKLIRY